MNNKFLLRKRAGQNCYWFGIGVDAAGQKTVEIYDDVAGTPRLIVPADAEVLHLIRDGLEQCFFFIGTDENPVLEAADADSTVPKASETVAASVETRSQMEVTKEQHARACQPWSPEEDDELRFKWRETQNSKVLSEHFGRNPGAIRSRAHKLGLID